MAHLSWAVSVKNEPHDVPVSVAELKQHLNIADDLDEHDQYLSSLIQQAVECVEYDSRQRLVTQTLELSLDAFPLGQTYIRLPGPLQSVTSVKYYDVQGNELTWDSANYLVDTRRDLLHLAYSSIWPVTQSLRPNSVLIELVAGSSIAQVPAMAKHAIKLLASHAFVNREPIVVGTISSELQLSYNALIHRITPGDYP